MLLRCSIRPLAGRGAQLADRARFPQRLEKGRRERQMVGVLNRGSSPVRGAATESPADLRLSTLPHDCTAAFGDRADGKGGVGREVHILLSNPLKRLDSEKEMQGNASEFHRFNPSRSLPGGSACGSANSDFRKAGWIPPPGLTGKGRS